MVDTVKQRYEPAFPIEKLRPHPKNAKLHDLLAIGESMQANKIFGTVLVQESTCYILSGHGTVEAAQDLGATTVPAMVMDVDDAHALRILLAANGIQERAGYDNEALAKLLSELAEEGELLGTGYDAESLDDLLATLEQTTDIEDFMGDYVEDEETAAIRGERMKNGPKAVRGLHEIVMVLPDEDFQAFSQRCMYLMKMWGLETTSEVVLKAVLAVNVKVKADA